MAKIKTCTPLNDGLSPTGAQNLWDNVEKFASYSFNKSHSVEYSLISYQSMWLKVYHPVEFFAAALTILKEEKRAGLVKDAVRHGIKVIPPDINVSSNEFEILAEDTLSAPFSIMKGLSANGAKAIMKARIIGGPFTSIKDFEDRVERRTVNKTVRAKLDKIGSYASVDPTQLPADHVDRRIDQLEIVPSIMVDGTIVDRDVKRDRATRIMVEHELNAFRDGEPICENQTFVKPRFGRDARFMVILDGPNWHDCKAGKFGTAKNDAIEEALDEAGLELTDAYWTALCKIPKKKDEKLYDPGVLHAFKPLLEKEIELLNPQVILCLGSNAARIFDTTLKGGVADHAGKVIYRKATDEKRTDDCNIVIGINPGMVYFDEDKQPLLNEAFQIVADMLG